MAREAGVRTLPLFFHFYFCLIPYGEQMNSIEERSISSIVHLSHADSKHPLSTARTFLFTKNNIHYLLVLFSALVRGKKYLHIPREKGNMQPNPKSSSE